MADNGGTAGRGREAPSPRLALAPRATQDLWVQGPRSEGSAGSAKVEEDKSKSWAAEKMRLYSSLAWLAVSYAYTSRRVPMRSRELVAGSVKSRLRSEAGGMSISPAEWSGRRHRRQKSGKGDAHRRKEAPEVRRVQ